MPINPTWIRDEVLLVYDLYLKSGRKSLSERNPDVIALSEYLRKLPWHADQWRDSEFRNSRGVATKIQQLKAYEEEREPFSMSIHRGVQAVAREFREHPERVHELAQAIRAGVEAQPGVLANIAGEEEAFPEGRVLERLHKHRERNRRLIQKKLGQVLGQTGRLACEACGFDFQEFYGERGAGFAECHHTLPLSTVGERDTRLEDLAVVCANCHRMLHRGQPMLTIQELREVLASR